MGKGLGASSFDRASGCSLTPYLDHSEISFIASTPASNKTAISNLGDSSDLFDEAEQIYNTFDSPPISVFSNATATQSQQTPGIARKNLESSSSRSRPTHIDSRKSRTPARNMVKQRDPPASQGRSDQNPASSEPSPTSGGTTSLSNLARLQQAPAQPNLEPKPVQKPLYQVANSAHEFGKTSPLRNPLARADNNLFNVPRPGQSRVEHHRPGPIGPPQFQVPPSLAPSSSSGSQPLQEKRALYPPPASSGQHVQEKRPLYPSLVSNAAPSTHGPTGASGYRPPGALNSSLDVVEIPRPTNLPTFTTQPAPRPVFSSWQTVNSGFTTRPVVDLTRTEDDEDSINPDDAFKHDRFGAPDPYMYVDTAKANENIKALLEGAFEDEEEEKPKLRRLRRKANEVAEKVAGSLASKLQALEVGNSKCSELKPDEEDDGEVDDGTVDGLTVKLLPHQVEGVAWMTDKEIGKKKTKGVFPKGGILADDMGLGKTIQSIALILTNSRPSEEEQPKNAKNRIPETVSKSTLVVAPLALIKQWEAEIKDKVEKSHALRVLVHHGAKRTFRADDLKKYDVVITTYQILASEHTSSSTLDDGPKIGCFGVHWYRVILDEAHTIKNRNAKSTQACYALRSHFRWCLTGTPMQNNLDELQSLIKFLRIKPYCDLGPWKAQITGPMKNGRGGLAMRRLQYVLKAFMKRRTKDILKKDGALNAGGKLKSGEAQFKIVERKVEIVTVEFTESERHFYQRLHDRAEERLQELMRGEKTNYLGALTLLLRLRQACNHPELVRGVSTKEKDALTVGATGGSGAPSDSQTSRKTHAFDKDVDDIADMLGGLSVAQKRCDICQKSLHIGDAPEGGIRCNECEEDLATQKAQNGKRKGKGGKDKQHHKIQPAGVASSSAARKSRQRPVVFDSDDEGQDGDWVVPKSEQHFEDLGKAGGSDDENAEGGGHWLNPDDSETDDETLETLEHPKDKVISLATTENEATASSIADESDASLDESESDEDNLLDIWPSTKIRHLIKILHKESAKHKFIVFSQFTSMLDLVEPFLKKEGFAFTRYDGSMRNDHREMSLNKLRNDPRCRVLLCSLKCGSLGLNLTAASRVVILEPFWNPFVEEQAIDRVHRLNQTVDVHIYRLTVADSVEQRILDLQEAKRNLAAAAIEGGATAMNKLSMQDILMLFKHDAHDVHGPSNDHGLGEHVGAFLGRGKVLDKAEPAKKQWLPVESSHSRGESSKPQRPPREEHSVYGRR